MPRSDEDQRGEQVVAMKKDVKNIPVLFAAGLVCLMYGAGRLYIAMRVDVIGIMIFVIGLACALVCGLRLRGNGQPRISMAGLRAYGFFAATVVVLAGVTVGMNYLACRFELRWDVTRARQHTLSQYTAEILRNLNARVEVTTFYVGMPPKYLEDLFQEYARVSGGKVKTAIFDPLVDIGYAAQFGNVISGQEKKVIVQSSGGRKDIDFTDAPLTEEQLTNAILQVTRRVRRVYFLSGHGEYDINSSEDNGLKTFAELLAKNNIESRTWVIALNGPVPQDCDVLIIAGPKEQFTPQEEQTVEEYLEAGGDALFLIEHTLITTPDKTLSEEELRKNPSLNNILTKWGIRIADDIVLDLASHASGDVGSPATRNYPAHNAIVSGLDYTFYVRPRSIAMLGNRRATIRVAPLVLTASTKESWGESNRNLIVKYDDLLDRPGPVPIAFVIWEQKQGDDPSDTRMAVFTDADFLSNAFIKQYSNAQMGLNAANWISELDYHVLIDRKDIAVERLDLTSQQKRVVIVILWAMPALIAGAGIMVWMRQRME
ncbi:MAG: GldG family protein [Candidatus Omnitrophica bacterium]|nr:GldG family protein [Candidatus Omnitrophota bacterium]